MKKPKAIIITESKQINKYIKQFLKQDNIDVEEEALLSDIEAIKENIHKVGNTSDIRNAFAKHIKDFGMPYVLFMDYMIDLGLDRSQDPDKRKLFRTFMISYAILLQGKGYSLSRNPLAFICDEYFESHLKIFVKSPNNIFRIMNTESPKINDFLQKFYNNPTLARNSFYIDYINKPINGVIHGQIHKIKDIISNAFKINDANQRIHASQNIKTEPKNESNPQTMVHKTGEDVSIVYKFRNNSVIVDGLPVEPNEEYDSLNHETVYVIGSWLSINQMAVSDKIKSVVYDKIYPVLKEEQKAKNNKNDILVTINLGSKCQLESIVLPSIIQLIEKDLKKIVAVSLEISIENKKKLSKSAGYSLIENYILSKI